MWLYAEHSDVKWSQIFVNVQDSDNDLQRAACLKSWHPPQTLFNLDLLYIKVRLLFPFTGSEQNHIWVADTF